MSPDRESTQSTDDSVRRIAKSLATTLRLAGISKRACERELGLTSGYLTRILAGEVHLCWRSRRASGCGVLVGFSDCLQPPSLPLSSPIPHSPKRLRVCFADLVLRDPQPESSPGNPDDALLQLREVMRRLELVESYLANSRQG